MVFSVFGGNAMIIACTVPRLVVVICTTGFNVPKFCVLPTQGIYVFCVDFRTNGNYFSVKHYLITLRSRIVLD
jgi:hypothetical protein